MLKKIGKAGLAAVAGSSLLIGPAFALAEAGPAAEAPTFADEARVVVEAAETAAPDKVEGSFAFNQTEVSTNEEIGRALGDSAKYLCGSQLGIGGSDVATSSLDWMIAVGGAVETEFSATLEELSEEGSAQIIMGCSCAGNPAGGLASVNAEVTGITIASIMEQAGVSADANTIVFSSTDGYEVALPLSYVTQRYSMVVYEVNGESICDSVGGANQVWLGSTSAKYFVRNVTGIGFEVRQTPPPNPYTEEGDDYYGNFPGIGVSAVEV